VSFAHPAWLWGVAAAAAAGALLAAASLRSRRLVRSLDPSFRGSGAFRSAILPAAVAALLSLAASRPRWGYRIEPAPGPESDVTIVLDTSGSMLVRDIQPDRFTRARIFVRQLLHRLPASTRVSLIRVEGSGEVVVPPTLDRQSLENSLDQISPRGAAAAGSDLAAGVAAARELLSGRRTRARRVVLVSDLESLEGSVESEARACRDTGVILDVILSGTAAGGPVPAAGGGFLKDGSGRAVLSRARPDIGRQAARIASGSFVDLGTAVGPPRFAPLPGPSAKTGGRVRVPADRTIWPLALAMIVWLGWMWPLRAGRPA